MGASSGVSSSNGLRRYCTKNGQITDLESTMTRGHEGPDSETPWGKYRKKIKIIVVLGRCIMIIMRCSLSYLQVADYRMPAPEY